MRKKRTLSALLAGALLCGLLVLPSAAADSPSPAFVDIPDPHVLECASLLQIMEVVDGNGYGYFFPDMSLTRAQFCKMAVNIQGERSKAEAQQNRTVFSDVPATHWGRGYINYASSVTLGESGERLVMGVGDGTFHPDDTIGFAEAVTMTMRLLGYTAGDVSAGAAWYDGYLSMAKTIELLKGLEDIPHDAPLDRARAAVLFRNLLFTKSKGSSNIYLTTLGGSEVDGSIVLDTDTTADDGSPAFQTTKGTYKTGRTFDPALEGKEGKAILNKDGKIIAFVPRENTTQRMVNITATEATYLLASGGDKITVEPDTVVYRDKKATTWSASYLSVTPPTPVTFHYDAAGKLSYIFFSAVDPDAEHIMVARRISTGVNPFANLAGGRSFSMFKNGAPATAADIRPYDVAVYDARAGVIQVSDLRLTGIYEDASPSPAAPVTVKLMGHSFPVLSTARNDLATFKVGDRVTLLLTPDSRVAGVVDPEAVKSEAVGVASISGTSATVKLLQGGLELSGTVSSSTGERCNDQLVTVTGTAVGKLGLTLISGGTVKGDLNVTARTIGDRSLAETVVVYDRAKDGSVVLVDYNSLTIPVISKEHISFVSYDYAGRVNNIVLDDVTGDAYQYGYFAYYPGTETVDGESTPPKLCVKQGGPDGKEVLTHKGVYLKGGARQNAAGGVAYNAKGNVAATVLLQSVHHVPRSSFDLEEMTVTVGGVTYVISPEVQCRNKGTDSWFVPGKDGLAAARAYSDDLTLYFDRPADEGGKVRLVEVP